MNSYTFSTSFGDIWLYRNKYSGILITIAGTDTLIYSHWYRKAERGPMSLLVAGELD